jgi:transcriptional regulator
VQLLDKPSTLSFGSTTAEPQIDASERNHKDLYIPKLYRQEDHGIIFDFVNRNNFPVLVSLTDGGLTGTHLPVEVSEQADGSWTIYSHMSRVNPQWKSFGEQEVMFVFQGPHTYISPRWYKHVNVPTWNYMTAHLYGRVEMLEGEAFKRMLGRLVEKHEAHSSYRMESLPAEFVEKEMRGTVGFAVKVTRIEAAYKLSQNRNDEDHANIVRELELRGDEESGRVAEAMRKMRP